MENSKKSRGALPQRKRLVGPRGPNGRSFNSRQMKLNSNSGMSAPKGAPAAISRRIQSVGPRITRTATSFRVAHRELVASSIAQATSFTVQNVFALNPGLAATFPWLAPQAQQWEQYKVHKLHALYIPIASTASAGDVTLSPDYDSSDPTPTTETQLSDNKDTVEDNIWSNLECRLNQTSMMGLGPRKFVRPCNVAGDIKTFDVGKLFVAMNNCSGTSAGGKLWLDYDFEFFVPQNSPSPSTYPQQSSQYSRSTAQVFTTGTAAPLQFGAADYDPLGFGAPVTGVFTPAAGCYKLESVVSCTDSSAENFTTLLQILKNGSALSVPANSESVIDSATTGIITNTSVMALVPCNGTDTVQIQVTLVGTAGTLQAIANGSKLIASLA